MRDSEFHFFPEFGSTAAEHRAVDAESQISSEYGGAPREFPRDLEEEERILNRDAEASFDGNSADASSKADSERIGEKDGRSGEGREQIRSGRTRSNGRNGAESSKSAKRRMQAKKVQGGKSAAQSAIQLFAAAASAVTLVTVASVISGGSFLPALGETAQEMAAQMDQPAFSTSGGMEMSDVIEKWFGGSNDSGDAEETVFQPDHSEDALEAAEPETVETLSRNVEDEAEQAAFLG